ncbi:unnamed protein product [Leptosia nina]|uniref:Uncharacterized protein n=1 Tax=Leptosia nina TaxID=320188 RepID=A0AAV1JKA1_9NEOP
MKVTCKTYLGAGDGDVTRTTLVSGGARRTGGQQLSSPRQQRPPSAPRAALHSVRPPGAVGRAAGLASHPHHGCLIPNHTSVGTRQHSLTSA